MRTRRKYMMRAARVSLFFNVVLFAVKLVALVVVHSLAIATDFAITVVGLIVSVILYKSLKLSTKDADLFHNYGYGKVEHVCEAMEGIILVGIAGIMSFQAFSAFFRPGHIELPWVGLLTSAIGLSLNFIGAFFIFKYAEKSMSPAVKAEGTHYLLEGFISASIAGAFLAAILLKRTSLVLVVPYIDPAITLVISIAVSVPSARLAKKAFINLLDASIEEPSKMETVVRLARNAEHFCNFRDLRTRTAGHKKFIEMKLIMPKEMPFARAHEITRVIEEDIAEGISGSEVSIKAVPCSMDCGIIADGGQCPYIGTA
ncbi:MAG: cation diffusion facilitator family transporter [Candidatus Omnitrophica bacterium]|nr:cation diffusion facilitator family transporter [Candidatus Omnitrophota bacterium]MDD5488491.1 cation diffusion facilitator family transporter [Candidatus Omnitrophota bacterium]